MPPPATHDDHQRRIRLGALTGGDEHPGFFSEMDRRFLEASPDCVTILSADGRVSYMNENGRALVEIGDLNEFAGRVWVDLWPESERAAAAAALASAGAGKVSRFTGFCPTARNQPKWWDVVVSPVTRRDGSVSAILAVSRDITHQQSIEQTLRTSEKHFRALANNIAQLAWMADPGGAVFWYNQRWFEFTGTTFNDMAGWGWTRVHHPEHLERVVEKFTDCLESGEEWEDVFPLRGSDGSFRWFLSRAMPLRDAAGRIELWCGTNTDITEQRNQSQRLRQLVRIIDLSHEAILVRDLTEGILIWNRGCEELYGYDKTQAIGANSNDLLKTRYPLPLQEFERLLVAEGSWSGEVLQIASDGSEVWVDSRQELIRISGRRLVLETNRDITDRRRADEIRNLLLGELNHRVKNTMAIIQSIASQTARSSRSMDSFVASFNGRLQSLASAHNVLTDSFWAGAEIGALVKSQLAVLGGLDDRIDVSGEDVFVPPQTALQFTLILHELATNAVKHGALSNDTGRVSITWTTDDSQPGILELVWRESGGPPVKAPAARGFGLNLIERSSQLPRLKSQTSFEEQGLVVRLKADLQEREADPELFNPGKKLMPLRAGAEAPRSRRQRVLIVERAPRDAMLLEDIMYEAGYVTLGPVTTLAEVTRKLEMLTCDMAIVDADGARAEVVAIVQALAAHAVPSVIIGSARSLSETESLERDVERLAKPLEPGALLATLAKLQAKAEAGAPRSKDN